MKHIDLSWQLVKLDCSRICIFGLSVAVTVASLMTTGCATVEEGETANADATEVAREPTEHAGEAAPGCIVEQDPNTGSVMEICGPSSLVESLYEAPNAESHGREGSTADVSERPVPSDLTESDAEVSTATQSLVGSSVPISASTTGAKVTAKLVWKSEKQFELRDVKLSDTSCDSHSVFFHAMIPGFQYPDHVNKNGCNTTATWSVLQGSSRYGIHALWLEVCRNKLIDNCNIGGSVVNPYCPLAC